MNPDTALIGCLVLFGGFFFIAFAIFFGGEWSANRFDSEEKLEEAGADVVEVVENLPL